MKIIKLDAIESTNTFLKELCYNEEVENYTVISTENQLKGRGQMTSNWNSDKGKNLTFSILIKFSSLHVSKQFYISKVVSLAVLDVLNSGFGLTFKIKWPNDIMSASKKVSGILIENSVKRSEIQYSIIGIGLNVNQDFFVNLPNASSLKMLSGKEYDLDNLLKKIINSIKINCELLYENQFNKIDKLYLQNLYRYNKPSMFKEVVNNRIFLGKIINVSENGGLNVALENESIKEFYLKEIEFLN